MAVVPGASADEDGVEAWAALLVDHPALAAGDVDAAAADWLARLVAEPDHPLAAATLSAIDAVFSDLGDPAALADGLLAAADGLRAAGMSGAARARLDRLLGELAATRAPAAELEGDLFPDVVARWEVLGPLVGRHAEGRSAWDVLAGPVAEGAAAGAGGTVRQGVEAVPPVAGGAPSWRAVRRHPARPTLELDAVVRPTRGSAAVAAHFAVDASGEAWLEIDTGLGGGTLARGDRSYAWRLDDGPVVEVDLLSAPQPARLHFPVVLSPGRHRLLLALPLEPSPAPNLSVRLRDGTGAAVPLRAPDAADGPAPAAAVLPPRGPQLADSRAFLIDLTGPGPATEALLGWLDVLAGLDPQGVARLTSAVARAPERTGLRVLLARALDQAWHLPDAWRRNRAREMTEAVLDERPDELQAGLFVVRLLANEDREEEALELLDRLNDHEASRWRVELARSAVHARLGMEWEAEDDLAAAAALAPDAPPVLVALARQADRVGRPGEAAALEERLLEVAGRTPGRLLRLAVRRSGLGDRQAAGALLEEAMARGGEGRLERVDFLLDGGRLEPARARLRELAAEHPLWSVPHERLADVEHLAAADGADRAAERGHLAAALALAPSRRDLRERMQAAGGPPASDLAAEFDVDAARVIARYDRDRWNESAVRVLDCALTEVFADGAQETVTHDIWHVRDLAAVEELGTVQLSGDVLAVRTIKGGDGSVHEPVRTGNYVMPSLQPGDFVETITRQVTPPSRDGTVRLGRWQFASVSEAFSTSRLVVSVPDALSLRLETHRFAGEHVVHERDGRAVHVFEARDVDRVDTEPFSPPQHWFLPWVEFGRDGSFEAAAATLRESTVPAAWLAPELEQAAREATAGLDSQQARARALHAFVNDHLDARQPYPAPALGALLLREGSAPMLYAALLAAAGVPRDLVWARRWEPAADPEPDPAFLDAGYWAHRLLVRVRPDDGPAAWCDLGPSPTRFLPYGTILDEGPGAPALVVESGERVTLPTVPMSERAGVVFEADLQVESDGAAHGRLAMGWTGPAGHLPKESFRNMPGAQRPRVATAYASAMLPGFDMRSFEFLGVESADEPVRVRIDGVAPRFLDAEGRCPLPLPAAQLGARFAGAGARALPFHLTQPMRQLAEVRLDLPPGRTLTGRPDDALVELPGGGRFRLTVARGDDAPGGGERWTVRRELVLPAGVIEPLDFALFVAGAARVDEIERARLAVGPSDGR